VLHLVDSGRGISGCRTLDMINRKSVTDYPSLVGAKISYVFMIVVFFIPYILSTPHARCNTAQ